MLATVALWPPLKICNDSMRRPTRHLTIFATMQVREFPRAGATTGVEAAGLQIAGFGATIFIHARGDPQHLHQSPSPHIGQNAPAFSSRGGLRAPDVPMES